MSLINPRTLIDLPISQNNDQLYVLKTLGNKEVNESVAISIGQKILDPYFIPADHNKDKIFEDFETKLECNDILIKVCTNLLGKIDTNLMVGFHGHVSGKNFEVVKRLGQHEVEVDHFSMDDQGILWSGRVKLTILAYKLEASREIVPKSHSFSLIMNSYFDKAISSKLNLGDNYGSLYSHYETKLRDTIIEKSDSEIYVEKEFCKILSLIENSRAESERELAQFLKALA